MLISSEEIFDLNDDEKKEALGDDKNEMFSAQNLFDDKKFSTIIIQQQQNETKQFVLDVEKFIQQYQNYNEKYELLIWLKKNNYKDLLINQIKSVKDEKILSQLIAAYWEAGFSDSKDLLLFIPYLLGNSFNIALEAYTCILALDKPFLEDDVRTSLQWIEQSYSKIASDVIFMIDEVKELLESQIRENN